ncbi:MAG: SDR family oxidoreductase [Pseudomonadota bacterium]
MRHVIVVGVGPGLGLALARKFAALGAAVGLIARSADELERHCAELAATDARAAYRAADAGDPAELAAAIASLEAENGPCDTLIYNAAVLRPGYPADLTTSRLRAEFDVNVIGAFSAAQAVWPGMVRRERGALLFTGGGLSLEPYPEWTSLALGKAALRNLAFSLHKDLSPQGIVVSVIAICGIIEPGGPFDPDRVAALYAELAAGSPADTPREVVFQPPGTNPDYNAPKQVPKGPAD